MTCDRLVLVQVHKHAVTPTLYLEEPLAPPECPQMPRMLALLQQMQLQVRILRLREQAAALVLPTELPLLAGHSRTSCGHSPACTLFGRVCLLHLLLSSRRCALLPGLCRAALAECRCSCAGRLSLGRHRHPCVSSCYAMWEQVCKSGAKLAVFGTLKATHVRAQQDGSASIGCGRECACMQDGVMQAAGCMREAYGSTAGGVLGSLLLAASALLQVLATKQNLPSNVPDCILKEVSASALGSSAGLV